MTRSLTPALLLTAFVGLTAAPAGTFEAGLATIRLAAQEDAREAARRPRLEPRQAPALKRVADAATWQSLVTRALTRPHQVRTVKIGGGTYKVHIVTSRQALLGQDCPPGTAAQNSLFVSKAVEGAGKDLYPVRITAACMGADAVRDSFSLTADWEGNIQDATVYNGSLGLAVSPLQEPLEPVEPSSLTAFLARLLKSFIEAP